MTDLSPAEELRAAAELIRDRAEAATPGPWHAFSHSQDWYVGSSFGQVTTGVHDEPGSDELVLIERDHADAEHIAGMHPGVALAVADWLDAEAAEYDELDASTQAFLAGDHGGDPDRAIVVARAYLSSSTEEK